MTNSRNKGAQGERDAANWLSDNFPIKARRGQQFSGSSDSPDVVFDDSLQIEVKRTERFKLDESLEQAKRDGGGAKIPVVMHRKNRTEWKFCIYAEDVVEFSKRILEIKYGVDLKRIL